MIFDLRFSIYDCRIASGDEAFVNHKSHFINGISAMSEWDITWGVFPDSKYVVLRTFLSGGRQKGRKSKSIIGSAADDNMLAEG